MSDVDMKVVDATLTVLVENGPMSGQQMNVDCLLASLVMDQMHERFKDQLDDLPPLFWKKLSDSFVENEVMPYCTPYIAGEIYTKVTTIIEELKKNSLLLSMSQSATESTDSSSAEPN